MQSYVPYPNTENPLDKIRLDRGKSGLYRHFTSLARLDPKKALEHLNCGSVSFCTLHLLSRHISALGLHSGLTPENQRALELSRKISGRKAPSDLLARVGEPSVHSALKWIFESGSRDDGLDNRYDEIIELSAVLLVRKFKDVSILPQLSDLIFERNRKGQFIHHLVWAFFEAHVPYSMVLLANRLFSPVREDAALALKLLGFIPCLSGINAENAGQQYYNVLYWIEDNLPFLYYTGEGFHQSRYPAPYAVSYSAKYICKPVSVETGEPMRALEGIEDALLSAFEKLDTSQKIHLSGFSYFLYRRNYTQWNTWIRYPLADQISLARMAVGSV